MILPALCGYVTPIHCCRFIQIKWGIR